MAEYETTIGLEIHAELKTRTKMFCSCKNDPDEQHPNVNVCAICLGHPGTLPSPNSEAIAMVQRVGAALGATLAEFSKFDRKNYFYPDLPKNYQISQYDLPFCRGGHLALPGGKIVQIERVHLEEDTGKLSHPETASHSLVDFNRAGVPLMELVTKPDISSGEEAAFFAQELQKILRYLGASDANMEKGQMRVEVNLSVSAGKELGTKVEVKNLNSFRSVLRAAEYETERQKNILENGNTIVHETRGWHDVKQVTFTQRTKEKAHDYRYFPEPDIPPFRFTPEYFDGIREQIPELPQARKVRFEKEYGLIPKEVELFVQEKELGEYFEEVMSELAAWAETEKIKDISDAKRLAVNYLLSDLLGLLRKHSSTIRDIAISAEDFAELISMLAQQKITSRIAKDVLAMMYKTGRDPSDILEEMGQVRGFPDARVLDVLAAKVIEANTQAVEDFRAGKIQALQFLIGKVIAETHGAANPESAKEALKKRIV